MVTIMSKAMKYKVLKVEWIDSVGGYGWQFIEDYETELATVTSYGYLVREDKNSITLAQSYAKETIKAREQMHNDITIPKCAISCVWQLTSCGQELVLERHPQDFSLADLLLDRGEPCSQDSQPV